MTPATMERVFGTSRLKMVTGPYVEVYREEALPGARRRYTKRFLSTKDGDFSGWTEREWRILARLVGHGARHVPDVVQYDRGAGGGPALVQTYDAGVTVDHWATLLPVQRGNRVQRHIFQDGAHWWALARHLLLALHEIHALHLVHLDLKADNICLPLAPIGFRPGGGRQTVHPVFEQIALIDFAFSLISGEVLKSPLPIGWQRTFPYQSPRLLQALVAGHNGDMEPTRRLDWRCDMYSLAALLRCFLPGADDLGSGRYPGWTAERQIAAQSLLLSIRDSHDRDTGAELPHLRLAAECTAQLQSADLESLDLGWTLIDDLDPVEGPPATAPWTPVTLIEPPPTPNALPTVVFVRRDQARLNVEPTPARPPGTSPDAVVGPTEPKQPSPPAEPAGLQPGHRRQPNRARTWSLWSAGVVAATAGLLAVWPTPPGGDELAQSAAGETTPADAVVGPGDFGGVAEREGGDRVVAGDGRPGGAGIVRPDVAGGAVSVTVTPAAPALPDAPAPTVPAARRPEVALTAVSSDPAPDAQHHAALAQTFVADRLPAVVERASPYIAQVLAAAAQAQNGAADRRTIEAAHAVGDVVFGGADAPRVTVASVSEGRRLNAAAQQAFWQQGDVERAFRQQWQAFGAHPNDAEIAGNLAFYALKMNPPQAETSRRLAIHALAVATRSTGASRLQDWGSLSVASALSGRPTDAENAMLVLLAVSRDVNRSCRSALSSVASFGPTMKVPAEALLLRVQSRGRAAQAPWCDWPPKWSAGSRFP